MIADYNLSFNLIEWKLFQKLMMFLNEGVMPLVNTITKNGIATHTNRMFIESEQTIKQDHLAKQIALLFTQDVWSAPNLTDDGSNCPLC